MIKKLSLIIVLFLFAVQLHAQNWGGGVDDEDVHFGFSFQYISAEYKIIKTPNWRDIFYDPIDGEQITSKLNSISSPPTPGFGIGFVVNKRISKNLDFRVTPSIVFSDRVIRYEYEPLEPTTTNGVTKTYLSSIDKKVQATLFDFPLTLKIKSNRIDNFRAYWIGGAKFSLDIGSKKKTFDDGEAAIDKFLKNKKNFISYESGIGFDLYFEYFKMSPEFKYSYSTSDILKHDNTAFATPIDKTMLRHFTFSLFFE
ncbi:PorT family protein [Pedobacter changchengzhani]|uniref:PorT family protein n=1 Tax=Pedobacter changchengzhani TaxID=2529274 RepID=A0A4R5MHR9_9SPHI|nr:outer membrane beta-barrel protein [Pedobacter changchengzhani]TDG35107.1 PorT family protein [Pedobacter changchengzhani]